jgi:dihydrolipoamide dehydrogenase
LDQFDIVVIGAGTGGYVAAIRAAQLGLRTAVVERQPVLGGTCLNWGCIPTKALLEHAHVLKLAQSAAEWGISFGAGATAPSLDIGRMHARKDKIVSGLTKGIEFLFKKHKIESIAGTARLAGGGRVVVSGAEPRTLHAREILIATGSAPRTVPGIAVDRERIITSDEAIHFQSIPKSIAILGSGAVGVEFASIFRRFGSEVTLIELQPRIVPSEDEAVSAELEKAFKKRGIEVRTGTRVTRAKTTPAGVAIDIEVPSGRKEALTVERLLLAVGRAPVTEGLGAEDAGVSLDQGFVIVDDRYCTNVPGISAVGDVIRVGAPSPPLGTSRPHPQLAHLSSMEGIVVAERVAGQDVTPINYDHVPACTYCDPEIGSVGLTEREAVARGFDVRTGSFPFGVLGRAKIAGEAEGFVKIVAEKRYDQLLGVHMIGPRATELVAEAVVALRLESTVEELIRTIHAHPTMSEAVGEAAHAAHGAAIHS